MMKKILMWFKQNLIFLYFLLSFIIIVFAYGVLVGNYKIFPYSTLKSGFDAAKNIFTEDLSKLSRNYPVYIYPARYEGTGLVVCDLQNVAEGVTLIGDYWPKNDQWFIGLRLVDIEGKILHEWHIEPQKLWEKSPYSDNLGLGDENHKTYIQGAILLPGGNVVFNIDYVGLIRLNKESEVVWKLPYRTHHSVFLDDSNSLWVSGRKWRYEASTRFPNLVPPFAEDTILKVSLNGEIEREISILEAIYKSDHKGLLFVGDTTNSGDVTHLNDVEVLSESLAGAFKQFSAGDIMVSLRNINTVMIIDGKTELIKWSITYPFIRQHDPDFTDRGYITVFDNQDDTTHDGSIFGGSRILQIDPSTNEVTTVYPKKKDKSFYTRTSGKHQWLPNGNLLLVECEAARVIEINPKGEIIWSYLGSRVDGKNVPEMPDAVRYSAQMADF
jgi:hypothetical protein